MQGRGQAPTKAEAQMDRSFWRVKYHLGLEEIDVRMRICYNEWHPHSAGMADLIQMAANVVTVSDSQELWQLFMDQE